MHAYKFDVTISENGTIFLPYVMPTLNGREAELFVVPKKEEKSKIEKKASARKFVDKWSGFLKDANIDPEKAKYEYLAEKYK